MYLKKGKIYALIGKNGAGKTTLMNSISNNLTINGELNTNINEDEILYIPSELKIYEFLTVKEFLNLLLKYNNTDTNYEYIIKKLKLENKENELIADLSQGMQKKLSLSSIFIRKFNLLILDEPFNSIDINYIYELKTYLKEISINCAILISSHILDTMVDLCDEFFIINNGTIKKHITKKTNNLEKEIIEYI